MKRKASQQMKINCKLFLSNMQYTVKYEETQSNSFSKSLFMQLKNKATNGATLKDLDEHVSELEGHLEHDEYTTQQLFEAEQARLESEVTALQDEIKQLQNQRSYLETKLDMVNEQAREIDVLFSADHDAYIKKIGEQYTLIEAIDELVYSINDKQGTILTNSEILQQLILVSQDQNINLLAKVTVNMDREQVDNIVKLFDELKTVITETVENDEFINESNVQLHAEIRQQVGNLIPETLELMDETLKSLEQQQNTLLLTQQQLKSLKTEVTDQSSERKFALEKVKEARVILLTNAEGLVDQ